MVALFTDSSSLAKRYITETGTAWIKNILDPTSNNEVYIARVTTVEIIAAITRRERGGTLPAFDANKARTDFRADIAANYLILEVTEELANRAMVVAETHGLRGYDAIQLAAGLSVNDLYRSAGLPPIIFLCSDTELNAAATAEGLMVDNSNFHP